MYFPIISSNFVQVQCFTLPENQLSETYEYTETHSITIVKVIDTFEMLQKMYGEAGVHIPPSLVLHSLPKFIPYPPTKRGVQGPSPRKNGCLKYV